jgi:taurine dioxygenase
MADGTERAAGIEVRPVAGHIGAEITGVDLAEGPADTVVAAIRAAVLRWKVVFFRGQRLDHAGQVAFARRFGEPVVLRKRGSASPADFPEVETTADRLELGGKFGMEHDEWLRRRRHTLLRGWHCDHGARIDPPAATILRAETVPPYGGDTTWSNLAAAYAGLSGPVREFVDGLRAEHRLGVGYQPRPGDDAYARHLLDHQVASLHPLVRVHPETGSGSSTSTATTSSRSPASRGPRAGRSSTCCWSRPYGPSTRSASAGSPAAWPSGTTGPPSTSPPATTPTSTSPGPCTG